MFPKILNFLFQNIYYIHSKKHLSKKGNKSINYLQNVLQMDTGR